MPRTDDAPEAMLTMEPPALLQHARQQRLDRAVHGLDVEVEGEVPILVGAFENRALMHEAGRIDENVERPGPSGDELPRRIRVRSTSSAALLRPLQPFELRDIEIRRPDLGAFARESASAMARPDAPAPPRVTSALSCR